MAQEITAASAALEGKVASGTATALGDQLRLVNSYYSNLIEGHKTTIPDIEMALRKEFSRNPRQTTPKAFVEQGGQITQGRIYARRFTKRQSC